MYYDPTNAGKTMTGAQLKSAEANLPRLAFTTKKVADIETIDVNTRNGFILNKDIQKMLDMPGAIGVRVYNLSHVFTSVLLAGVDNEGGEIKGTTFPASDYLFVERASGRNDQAEFLNKDDAKNRWAQVDPADKFTAFFFKDELESVMNGNDGVGFYKLPLAGVDAKDVPQYILDQKKEFLTFVAIGERITDATPPQIIPVDLNGPVQNAVSVVPCPGHCSSLENIRKGSVGVDTDKYLDPSAW